MAKMPQLHFYKVKEVIKIVDGDTVDLLIDLCFETYRKTRVRMSVSYTHLTLPTKA